MVGKRQTKGSADDCTLASLAHHLPCVSSSPDSVKKLQDQKHDMEREIKILHRKLRVSSSTRLGKRAFFSPRFVLLNTSKSKRLLF